MKCPGQDTRYWKPGDIFEVDCPNCGSKVEFFKDEATRRCRKCKNMMVNPRMNFGCASYCQYAAQCLGELGPELLAKRNDLLKDKVAIEMKRQLGREFHKIGHAIRVAKYVEEIAPAEKAEPALLLCAAYLHVFSESDGEDRLAGGQGTAREILTRLGAGPELVEKVLGVIDRFFTQSGEDSISARVFADAHLLASIEEGRNQPPPSQSEAVPVMNGAPVTETGQRILSGMSL
jgi:hypothetical protein